MAVSGTGKLDARNFDCDNVEVAISGVGKVTVCATSSLAARIAAWARVGHFLLVEIEADEMRIQAIGIDGQAVRYRLRDGSVSDAPVVVRREE